jgi:hypothetical protein
LQIVERDPVGGGALVAKDFWSSQRSIRHNRCSARMLSLASHDAAANACAPWTSWLLRARPSGAVPRLHLLLSRTCLQLELLPPASRSGARENCRWSTVHPRAIDSEP